MIMHETAKENLRNAIIAMFHGDSNLKQRISKYINPAVNYALSLYKDKSFREVVNQITDDFKNWVNYVEYEKNTFNSDFPDVNTLNYNQFKDLIHRVQSHYDSPNELYSDSNIFCGEFKYKQEAQMFPSVRAWCIQNRNNDKNPWEKHKKDGSRFLIIKSNEMNVPYKFVLVEIVKGNVKYFDSNHDILIDNGLYADKFIEYEKKLPDKVKSIIYNIAADQTERKEKES